MKSKWVLNEWRDWYWRELRPSLLFYEMFITKPIGLVWVYLSLYTPTLFHILVHVIGYIRVQVWNQTGSDTLDVPTLLKSTIDMLMGRL